MKNAKIQIRPSSLKELVIENKTFRSSLDFHLSEADLEKSRKELKETEEAKNASLDKLKKMLKRDKDIKYRTEDAYLLRYLRFRKFNCKQAYNTLRHFYRTRKEYPDVFHLPHDKESLLNKKICCLMPYTNEEGSPIFILKFANWKTDEMTVRDLLRLMPLICDIVSINPHIQINGIIGIWDFAGTTVSHIAHIVHPRTLRLWTKLMQELYPFRIMRIIVFNCNALMYTSFIGIRYFLKKKIADRVTLLRSDQSLLHEYVNPVLLPEEYGGSLQDEECNSYLIQPILDNVRYLENEQTFIGV